MLPAPALIARAERLTAIKCQLDDLASEAGELLTGLGPIRDRARAWLAALDRATGAEPQTTIDDTIEDILSEAEVAGGRADAVLARDA
jgi:hypothetical protein